jgi:hypothetical protein
LKLFLELGKRVTKENGGRGNLTMIYLIYCKNFCKCQNVPPPRTTIKENLSEKVKRKIKKI